MAVAVSVKGVENLVKWINAVYGKEIVTAKLHSDGWLILIGKESRIILNTCEAVQFLDGVMCMIKVVKDNF